VSHFQVQVKNRICPRIPPVFHPHYAYLIHLLFHLNLIKLKPLSWRERRKLRHRRPRLLRTKRLPTGRQLRQQPQIIHIIRRRERVVNFGLLVKRVRERMLCRLVGWDNDLVSGFGIVVCLPRGEADCALGDQERLVMHAVPVLGRA